MFVNPLVESGKDFQASLAILPIFLSPEKICSDKSSNLESVNETRMELFIIETKSSTYKSCSFSTLNFIEDYNTYQPSIRTTSELPQQNRPSPASWGWS